MKIDRLSWLIAPIALYALAASLFFDLDPSWRRSSSIALVLSMAWILIRDYTKLSHTTIVWLLAASYGVMILMFMLLPAPSEYTWWRFGGTVISLAFGLYIVAKRRTI